VNRRTRAVPLLALALTLPAVLAPTASAKWYGSTLSGKPNADYGCETALVNGTFGIQRAPTNQSSCTYRHAGYLFRNRFTFLTPGTGRITKIRIKSGPNPARARLTVLTGSSRVDPFTGRDQPGTYTCCTARYISRPFKLKANGITTKKTNVKVYDVRDKQLQVRIHYSDGLALSFERGGTVPLKVTNALGSFDAGTPQLVGYWPRTGKNDPRVDGYALGGIDLMFQWNWVRARR
jgi:hypothetical protein